MNHQNQKKIKRSYYISPTLDKMLRRAAKELNQSQGEIIELCVLEKTHEIVARHNLLKRLSTTEDFPEELGNLIRRARDDVLKSWAKTNR